MEAKISCPNPKCPAPQGSHLTKSGYGDTARQLCGMRHKYTLLTERLKCLHCMRHRQQSKSEDQPLQYRWHAFSPSILMQLAPAVRNMFPAILCGKRAIDKDVVTLLSDRLNSVSMNKVHRMIQQGHDEWYGERRDLYQTLLMEAHTASTASTSQRGILSYTDHHYTPPIPSIPLPPPPPPCPTESTSHHGDGEDARVQSIHLECNGRDTLHRWYQTGVYLLYPYYHNYWYSNTAVKYVNKKHNKYRLKF